LTPSGSPKVSHFTKPPRPHPGYKLPPTGGQFLRAYVELYSHAVAPVHNLITFGSQHMGISDLPLCNPGDLPCQLARRLAKSAVYSKWAQENLVQAQYFRDPKNLPTYLASNTFLTALNNEIPESRNATFARNLASLDALVLILFEQDRTVVPKESAWFGSEAEAEPEPDLLATDHGQILLGSGTSEPPTIIPMREQPLYVEDWIGLRELDERGGVIFKTCAGEHMRIGDCWEAIVRNFTGTLV
jgi:palmitoyl-protein thioesterase